jgi:hypothetical protein
MSESRKKEPLSLKALEDLDTLIFEELDPNFLDFFMFGRMGKADEFIEFLLLGYHTQCKD